MLEYKLTPALQRYAHLCPPSFNDEDIVWYNHKALTNGNDSLEMLLEMCKVNDNVNYVSFDKGWVIFEFSKAHRNLMIISSFVLFPDSRLTQKRALAWLLVFARTNDIDTIRIFTSRNPRTWERRWGFNLIREADLEKNELHTLERKLEYKPCIGRA